MLDLAWVLSCIAAYLLGWHYRKLIDGLETIKQKLTPPKKEEPAQSVILDPDDLDQKIRFEHQQRLKELNPEKDDL